MLNEHYNLKKNHSIDIPKGAKHRVENKEKTPLTIIEIQTGPVLSEEDIDRIKDKYKREKEILKF